MSLKVSIETTIPSFYFETRRNVECVSRRNWTRRWWNEHRHEHKLATSLVVQNELSDPTYPEAKRRNALALVSELPMLDLGARIEEIVEAYVENLLMPQQPTADAIHLVLLTWNCVHLANPNKFRHIANINKRLGVAVPAVITPLELLGDTL